MGIVNVDDFNTKVLARYDLALAKGRAVPVLAGFFRGYVPGPVGLEALLTAEENPGALVHLYDGVK
jgi:hypothetical protein